MCQAVHRIGSGLFIVVILVCLLSIVAPAAVDGGRNYASRSMFLILDQNNSGFLNSVDGGGVSAEVIDEPMGADYTVKKHIGPPIYEPFTAQLMFPIAQSVSQWISDSWSMKPTRHSGSIMFLDSDLNCLEQNEFTDALLTETAIPACDASNENDGYVTMTFAPESIRSIPPGQPKGTGGKNKDRAWLLCNFKLAIDGLDCTRVSKIDAFTVKQTLANELIGESRDYQKKPSKLVFPNLKITLSESDAASWQAWQEDFLIKGNNDQTKEKNGTLVLLGAKQKDELARIEFYNLGICGIGADKSVANNEKVKYVTAELYCERMVFKTPDAGAIGSAAQDSAVDSDPGKRVGDKNTTPARRSANTEDVKEPTDDCQPGQTYAIGKNTRLNLTVNSLEYTIGRVKTGTHYDRPGVNEKLLLVHYTLQNPAQSDVHVGRVSIDWVETDSNGVNREQDFVGIESTGDPLDQTLSPGKSVDCFAVISMPAIGVASTLTAPMHGDKSAVAHYNLQDKVTPLSAPFANPKDPTGSTPMESIRGKVGSEYSVGDYDMTVESVQFSEQDVADWKLPKGQVYAMMTVKCTSYAEGANTIMGSNTELKDADGQSYFSRGTVALNSLREVTIKPEPGETVSFRLVFSVPRNTALKSLSFKGSAARPVIIDMSSYKTP